MSMDYAVHWFLGFLCALIWAKGEAWGLPPAMVQLSASVVPGILAHALNYTPPVGDNTTPKP